VRFVPIFEGFFDYKYRLVSEETLREGGLKTRV